MGKITGCSISLKKTSAVYRAGEVIEGSVDLDVEGEVRINAVRVFLSGMALAKWYEPLKKLSTQSGTETYINLFQRLLDQTAEKLTTGTYNFRFKFHLPRHELPSSFEGQHGAVRYWLRLQVDKKFPAFDSNFYRHFTVLANINVNDPEFKKVLWYRSTKSMSKALVFGNVGTVTLRAWTDRAAYCPGEKIKISLEAFNESTKDCGVVKATLCQDVKFNAGQDTNSTSARIRVLNDETLVAGKTVKWERKELTVPVVPPSTAHLTCHIIKVSYCVHVEVEVSMGFNLSLELPITIGTIPLGASPPTTAEPAGASSSTGGDSKGLNYKVCQFGIMEFSESSDDFMRVHFEPKNVVVETQQPGKVTAVSTSASSNGTKQTALTVTPKKDTSPSPSASPRTYSSPAAATSLPKKQPSPPSPSVPSVPPTPEKQPSPSVPSVPQTPEKQPPPSVPSVPPTPEKQPSPSVPSVPPTPEKQPSLRSTEIHTTQVKSPLPSSAAASATPHKNPLPTSAPAYSSLFPTAPQEENPELNGRSLADLPPTYEEAMAMELPPQNYNVEHGPTPYHLIESVDNGCVLLLLFPSKLSTEVQVNFRRSVVNMALHSGQIIGFIRQLSLLPTNPETSAVLLYFPSQRASLSWLQNQTSGDPDLASSWWAIVAENTKFVSVPASELPAPPQAQGPAGVVAVTYAKINLPAYASQAKRDEAAKVAARVRELGNQIEKHKVLNSSKVLFAWGDWTSFPHRGSDRCVFYVRQYDSEEKYQAHQKLISEDPLAKRTFEDYVLPVLQQTFPVKDVALFQN